MKSASGAPRFVKRAAPSAACTTSIIANDALMLARLAPSSAGGWQALRRKGRERLRGARKNRRPGLPFEKPDRR